MTVNLAICIGSSRPAACLAQLGNLDRAAGEADAEPEHAAQVGEGGGDDVDP
jgi:hypothetical protein